jgi:hypothetical protein
MTCFRAVTCLFALALSMSFTRLLSAAPAVPPPPRQATGMKFVPADVLWDQPVYETTFDDPAGSFQTVRIYKRGGAIRCLVDDVVALAYDDDGATFGPVWTHRGWIGLRQMAHTVRCEYGHVKVWPLKPAKRF